MGPNIHNLKLTSPSPKQKNSHELLLPTYEGSTTPVRSPSSKDDDQIINILPSYQMYQSTISKNLTPTREDLRTEPPSYELTSQTSSTTVSSNSSVNDYFVGVSVPSSPELSSSRAPFESAPHDETVDDFTPWEDTILANSHKLKRISSINKDISRLLNVQIHFTELLGKIGVKPNIINPLDMELKQGDCIYGYVTVTNRTDTAIPFDMFAVVLEGSVTFGDNQKPTMQLPIHMTKFLNMFDFNASWNDGFLDRLKTDNNNPHNVQGKQLDPVDGTQTQLDHKRVFEPQLTYKKFFTFRLPEKLLDSSCPHGFINHMQLPHTLGVSRNEVISLLRHKWRDGPGPDSAAGSPAAGDSVKTDDYFRLPTNGSTSSIKSRYAMGTNDFCFQDVSVSYSVSARIIGKASDYEDFFVRKAAHLDPDSEEYVVANEDNRYLRAIFNSHSSFELNRSMINEEARLIYANMVHKIEEKIILGKELSNNPADDRLIASTSGLSLEPTSSASELAKMLQSYYTKMKHIDDNHHETRQNTYEVLLPYKKKTVLGSSKIIGLAALSTPKSEYRVSYVSLPKFRQATSDTKITIPLNLVFWFNEINNYSAPEFKKVSVELVVLTIKSKDLPIPTVFHADMMFLNKSRGPDSFEYLTIKKFQKYAHDLTKILKEIGPGRLDIDKDMIHDIKALANLKCKSDILKVEKPAFSQPHSKNTTSLLNNIPWETKIIESTTAGGAIEKQTQFYKKFDLHLDLANTIMPGTGSKDFCLVPDFQHCMVARLYYLRIELKCPNGDKIPIKVPLVLQRQRDSTFNESELFSP